MALGSLVQGLAGRSHIALGLALVLGGLGAIGVAAQPVGGTTESLALFAEMMPVLSHPRCTNCHGGVDVTNGTNHGGGEVSDVPLDPQGDMLPGTQSNEQCLDCHDEASASGQPQVWRLAPRRMSMVGKDTLTLCQQLRTLNGLGGASSQAANERFIDHLGSDQLIGFAFEGRRGGAMLPEHSPEPPPMSQAEFIAAASRWVNEGQAKCGSGWTGSIVQRTALRSTSPGSILSTDITITVNVNGANSTARVRVVGSTIQDGATVNGCATFNHENFSADGTVPAVVAIGVSPPLPGMEHIPGLPDMGVDVPDFASGGYQISFGVQPVPGEHHIETQSVTLPPARSCQRTTKDPPYSYAAPGGSILKSLGADQPDHLVGHDEKSVGGNTITTDWDLTEN